MESIHIPNSLTVINDYTFQSCSTIYSLLIPTSVTSIGRNAFAFNTNITEITIPSSVKTISAQAFLLCKFTCIVWDSNVKRTIDTNALPTTVTCGELIISFSFSLLFLFFNYNSTS